MDKKIRELIGRMTLDEKASLCSGLNHWETKPVERLAIPSVMMSDGPHGLRKQEQDPDHLAPFGKCAGHMLSHGVGACLHLEQGSA